MNGWNARAVRLGAVALASWLLLAAHAEAGEPWERFIGKYEGEALSETVEGLQQRDLEVVIRGVSGGFRVEWTSVTRKADGRLKRKSYGIDFRPSRRDGVYESAMRKDLFGNREPLDPMRGDPYVWARIADDTLSVFALLITSTGSYEMQVYHRTLIDTGLALRYTRFSEGEVVRTVEGTLVRR